MQTEQLSHPVVRAVVSAMNDGYRDAFFAAFSPTAELTDDGNPQPFAAWTDREIFRGHGSLRVEGEDRGGLRLTGRFRSDRWDMNTLWRFQLSEDRVARLDVTV